MWTITYFLKVSLCLFYSTVLYVIHPYFLLALLLWASFFFPLSSFSRSFPISRSILPLSLPFSLQLSVLFLPADQRERGGKFLPPSTQAPFPKPLCFALYSVLVFTPLPPPLLFKLLHTVLTDSVTPTDTTTEQNRTEHTLHYSSVERYKTFATATCFSWLLSYAGTYWYYSSIVYVCTHVQCLIRKSEWISLSFPKKEKKSVAKIARGVGGWLVDEKGKKEGREELVWNISWGAATNLQCTYSRESVWCLQRRTRLTHTYPT